MWISLAADVPDGLIFGLAPIAVAGLIALIAFLVKGQGKNERDIGLNSLHDIDQDKDLDDHERRLRRLEER